MSQRLLTAQRAARAAGKVLAAKLHDRRDIRHKGKRDIVTDADYAADRTIKQIVLSRFPDHKFVSEEGDAAEQKQLWAQARKSDGVALWVRAFGRSKQLPAINPTARMTTKESARTWEKVRR